MPGRICFWCVFVHFRALKTIVDVRFVFYLIVAASAIGYVVFLLFKSCVIILLMSLEEQITLLPCVSDRRLLLISWICIPVIGPHVVSCKLDWTER